MAEDKGTGGDTGCLGKTTFDDVWTEIQGQVSRAKTLHSLLAKGQDEDGLHNQVDDKERVQSQVRNCSSEATVLGASSVTRGRRTNARSSPSSWSTTLLVSSSAYF